ncbi:polysaccharide deacetylase family protein [Arsenophonus nasoniae]|uniref:Poly-beta-1,6-N-acetyl-D-glucosamine N-deacetylase n=4 Tax=Arsenophonus nasoniae TaxID=638 RepID=D2TVR6_9GAMM|nr:polysaccharide deacetylase family protein [Arsenophonus nasoniae]QBY42874.1 Poly-beta-1,6-N-acetyl-D-glucosamine N-deacetylase [Arsenophonus nasoniae]WGL96201.1 polysaccharide deacetylase family protein [Arsenophonus nasoniae]WGM02686.1 polysaccharide deacetylase family protein [Arsenophonus nasoniae]WGM06935.1 polysaccharide deacetylase family protein [Arsenophonus nasoniae]WGM11816.1 polysaccharide deacetylase family protein [Arsenophonus nasoniae]
MNAITIPILMYHHVSPSPGLVTLSPKTFTQQMTWLANSGWKTLSTKELEQFYQGKPFPRKSVMITFDDGYLDNWVYAFPVLEQLQLKASIFLITKDIGNGKVRKLSNIGYSHRECEIKIGNGQADDVMLRWSEIEHMQASELIEFHNHTYSHLRWDQLETNIERRHAALIADIEQCRNILIKQLGYCSQHLCWPQGFYTRDYAKIAKELGFNYLYTTERRMNRACQPETWRLGRISTKEREDTQWLKRRLFYYTTPVVSSLYALHKGVRYT